MSYGRREGLFLFREVVPQLHLYSDNHFEYFLVAKHPEPVKASGTTTIFGLPLLLVYLKQTFHCRVVKIKTSESISIGPTGTFIFRPSTYPKDPKVPNSFLIFAGRGS